MKRVRRHAKGFNAERQSFRKFRKQAGLSLKELGEMAGLSETMLSLFENDKRDLSVESIKKIGEAISDVLSGKKLADLRKAESVKKLMESAKGHVNRHVQGVERARIKYSDYDETVNSHPWLARLNPPKDPKALELWKVSQAKELVEADLATAREYGSVENFNKMVADKVRIKELEAEVARLTEQNNTKDKLIQSQQGHLQTLRDLLDLKTKEVLLRDKIESEALAESSAQENIDKKETTPKDGDD